MRSSKPIINTHEFPKPTEDGILILFQNVRSFKPYFASDSYLRADLLILAETRLSNKIRDSTLHIEGNNTYRHDSPNPGYRIIVFSRIPLNDMQISMHRALLYA